MGNSRVPALFKNSISERISKFLHQCNKRVNSRPLHQKQFPNHTRLAKLCFCHKSTINRIATGDQQTVKRETLDVICALAGIAPSAKLGRSFQRADMMRERQRRLEDAERAEKNGANSIDDVIDAIIFGIEERVKELAE